MKRKIAVIGVGNMARSIISGIVSSSLPVEKIFLYDKAESACDNYMNNNDFIIVSNINYTLYTHTHR
jgi:pyrroline-5-carboxylate reductase